MLSGTISLQRVRSTSNHLVPHTSASKPVHGEDGARNSKKLDWADAVLENRCYPAATTIFGLPFWSLRITVRVREGLGKRPNGPPFTERFDVANMAAWNTQLRQHIHARSTSIKNNGASSITRNQPRKGCVTL
jgi:hypothetical protein